MSEKKTMLTYDGLKKLEEELHELKVVKRKQIAEKIKEARGQGDLSENAEYDAAKEEQAETEARIAILEKMLRNAEVIDVEDLDTKTIGLGAKVRLYDEEFKEEVEYTIVGSTEADPLNGRISNESPLGSVLMGQAKGAKVEAQTPGGLAYYKVLEISR